MRLMRRERLCIAGATDLLYNGLMLLRASTALLAGILLVLPTHAAAYMSPDEVIFSEMLLYPPRRSEARKRAETQMQQSTDMRNATYDQLRTQKDAENTANEPAATEGAATSQEELMKQLADILQSLQGGAGHPAAPGATDDALVEEEGIALDPETYRLLQRIQRHQDEPESPYGGEVLHSGAPLTDTGFGTPVSLLMLTVIGWFVLRRARRNVTVEMSW
ncbi:MAG: hypothetical protein G01um101425_248 [Candidatus Peregrinibacteria bacterium Gr01-1014_25]|nr:MAG: hypothetical protein G01um101425_248 [Candidatus Peregrinibacteria bacterium Gr01-1014_25]